MSTLRAMPLLEVTDVTRAAAFYGRLGFANHGAWDDGGVAQFTIMQRGDVTLGLTLADTPARNTWWATYIYVSDVAALHAEFTALGIEVTPINHPDHYACDDFDVVDPDGHRIAFGQARAPKPGPGLGDDRGRG
ncbi:MAG: VOC family protein [Pseudomonadota bacterium]